MTQQQDPRFPGCPHQTCVCAQLAAQDVDIKEMVFNTLLTAGVLVIGPNGVALLEVVAASDAPATAPEEDLGGARTILDLFDRPVFDLEAVQA